MTFDINLEFFLLLALIQNHIWFDNILILVISHWYFKFEKPGKLVVKHNVKCHFLENRPYLIVLGKTCQYNIGNAILVTMT